MTDWSVIILPDPRWVKPRDRIQRIRSPSPSYPQRFVPRAVSALVYRPPPAVYDARNFYVDPGAT